MSSKPTACAGFVATQATCLFLTVVTSHTAHAQSSGAATGDPHIQACRQFMARLDRTPYAQHTPNDDSAYGRCEEEIFNFNQSITTQLGGNSYQYSPHIRAIKLNSAFGQALSNGIPLPIFSDLHSDKFSWADNDFKSAPQPMRSRNNFTPFVLSDKRRLAIIADNTGKQWVLGKFDDGSYGAILLLEFRSLAIAEDDAEFVGTFGTGNGPVSFVGKQMYLYVQETGRWRAALWHNCHTYGDKSEDPLPANASLFICDSDGSKFKSGKFRVQVTVSNMKVDLAKVD